MACSCIKYAPSSIVSTNAILPFHMAKLPQFQSNARKIPFFVRLYICLGLYFHDRLLARVLTHTADIFNHAELNNLQTLMEPKSIESGLPVMTPVSQWIVGYAHLMGEWFDQPNSITPDSYASFWDAPKYRMDDYFIPKPSDSVGGFTSFNHFFCRKLKEDYPYPNVRPIDHESNGVISPADAKFDGHWGVDGHNYVKIKTLEWPISALLHGCPPDYIDRFKGGTWCHSFLNTFNYHRQHAPVAGKVSDQCSMLVIEVPWRRRTPAFFFIIELALLKTSFRGRILAIVALSKCPDSNADCFHRSCTQVSSPGFVTSRS